MISNCPAWLRTLLLIALGGIAAGCSSPHESFPLPPPPAKPRSTGSFGRKVTVPITCPVKPPDPSRTRVMVVDTGFDLRHPIFKDKIAGCYEIECPASPSFDTSIVETDDERAARYVAYLAEPGPACTLKEGLSVEVDSYLEEFDPQSRATWNEKLLAKDRFDESWDVETILKAGISADAHGTATAGAIAYQNDVDIVVVQIKLGTYEDTAATISCISQADVDRDTRILSRSEVAAAYLTAPLEGDEQLLMDVRRRHGVRVENHSFGPLSNRAFETLMAVRRCGRVKLEQNTLVQSELDARRLEALRAKGVFDGTDVLTFQSSGNYSEKIDDGGDSLACTPRRTDRLLIGAYDLYREQPIISDFTNYGDCVDAYALGDTVLLPTAAGFYAPFSGTSFASPLAARYASSLVQEGDSAASLRERILAARDGNRFLPVTAMPTELSLETWSRAEPAARQGLAAMRFERYRRSRLRLGE